MLLIPGTSSAVDSTPQAITIDGQDTGRNFDGIGALSAGASSRLLIDYPEPQRSEILDFLFKPNFGAALQINKVEIGGDMNSTDGSEPSHMRTATDENYQRGYEWWLMAESKKRNPTVKLSGLEWGAPNWINPAKNHVWTRQNIDYILKWVRHAKSDYGLNINYLGGWNERGHDVEWYKQFRQALNDAGYSQLKVVGDDSFDWKIAEDIQKDPAFAASFDIIGMHYPGAEPKNKEHWKTCLDTGKAISGAEIGSQTYHGGAKGLARLYNQGYIGSRMSSFINWSTIWAVLAGMPYSGDGLMLADEPWSAHYVVGLSIWATAHTTQFTQIGWQYLDHACACIDGTSANGSVVALRSPDRRDFSVIVETIDARQPRTATFSITGGLPTGPLHVWKTKMGSRADADWFIQQPDITPAAGQFSLTLDPSCLYTISTLASAHKGITTPPPSSMLPLPYKEDFQSYEIGRTPKYLSDQHGTFEVASAGGGRSGKCLRQMVNVKPVHWNSDADPGTIVGDPRWWNYTVSADALLEQPGYVELVGRMMGTKEQNVITGYHLRLDERGHWSLRVVYDPKVKTDPAQKELTSGELPNAAGAGKWHTLSLSFLGTRITAAIDHQPVGQSVEDTAFSRGLVGLVTSRWNTSAFMNLEVIPNGVQPEASKAGGLLQEGARIIGCDSEADEYAASCAIDGSADTFWHTVWQPKQAPFPHFLAIDLGKSRTFRGLCILPRPDLDTCRMADCEVYVSETPGQWGVPVATVKLEDTGASQPIVFKAPASGRYLKLETKSSHKQSPNTAIAELEILQ